MLIQQVKKIIEAKHVLKHPFYQDWMEGKLSIEQLQNYAKQYMPFVDAFPRFVSSAHSLCEDQEQRNLLLENLMDEEGKTHSEPHPKLWRDFENGLGGSKSAYEEQSCSYELRDTFMSLCRSSFSEAICALYAYESQIPSVAKAKVEGLEKNYDIADERTLRFFKVHQIADVYHSQACEKIIQAIPEHERTKAVKATEKATDALWSFLTSVH